MKIICKIEGCLRPVRCRLMCSMHYKRWKRTGHPEVKGIPNFKGDKAGYLAIHARLRNQIGQPTAFNCPCGEQAQEWAYLHTGVNEKTEEIDGRSIKYSVDLTQYQAMCISCHRKMDS